MSVLRQLSASHNFHHLTREIKHARIKYPAHVALWDGGRGVRYVIWIWGYTDCMTHSCIQPLISPWVIPMLSAIQHPPRQISYFIPVGQQNLYSAISSWTCYSHTIHSYHEDERNFRILFYFMPQTCPTWSTLTTYKYVFMYQI